MHDEIDPTNATPAQQLMRSLILGVAHLCGRTRALAAAEAQPELLLAPVRESLELVERTFRALEEQLDGDAPFEDLSALVPGNLEDTNSWLVDVAALREFETGA